MGEFCLKPKVVPRESNPSLDPSVSNKDASNKDACAASNTKTATEASTDEGTVESAVCTKQKPSETEGIVSHGETQAEQSSVLADLRMRARNASLQAVKDGALTKAFQELSATPKQEGEEANSQVPVAAPQPPSLGRCESPSPD